MGTYDVCRHPTCIPGVGEDFESVGVRVVESGPEGFSGVVRGMIARIREEASVDAARGRVRLAALLRSALGSAKDLADRISAVSDEAAVTSSPWQFDAAPETLGRGIVSLRYDLTCRVLRGMLDAVGNRDRMAGFRVVMPQVLALVATFRRIEGLCLPYIDREKACE